MPVGRQNPGPLWVDGTITLRVRDRGHRSWRTVRVRQPYAVLGSHPDADLVIPRDEVADSHVFLFLDRRGLFGVDLRTDSGTRFAGSDAEAAWLGSGDLIEVGDHVIEVLQLRVDGTVLSHSLSNDDPLGATADAGGNLISELTLRHVDAPDHRWSIGSSLVFLGRGPACAVQVGGTAVGLTHSALLRFGPTAHLIRFPGEVARVNHEAAPPVVRLDDGDVLSIGPDSLLVQTHEVGSAAAPAGPFDNLVTRLELAVGPDSFTDIDFAFGDHRQAPQNPVDYPALIGRLQAETAALVAILLRRIEALDDEMALLREQMDALMARGMGQAAGPPVEKLRWDLIPQATPEGQTEAQSGAWLVDRMRDLEAERQSTWSNLLNRLAPNRPAG